MRNLNPTITKIDAQVAQLTASLQQSTPSPRPQWTQGDNNSQSRMINKAVGKIIATQLAQDPQLPVAKLPPTEQKALFHQLAQYTKLVTAQIMQALKPASTSNASNNEEANKKENINKKIIAAKKLLALLMVVLYESQSQAYIKKVRKILRRLAALEDKKKQQEMLALIARQEQEFEPAPLLIPAPKPFHMPIPKPAETPDYALSEHLQLLGLPLDADHAAIEASFKNLQQEFLAKQTATLEEQAQFSLIEKAYKALKATPAQRLAELPKITGQEIQDFAAAFKAQMPDMLSSGKTVSLEALKTVFIEGGIQKNLEGESADTSIQMRKMQLTITKLEKQFGSDPKQLINLTQEFLNPQAQAQSTARASHTPTLKPPKGY